jgi:hypothetical protein
MAAMQRIVLTIMLVIACAATTPALAQGNAAGASGTQYGINPDSKRFPQSEPKQAITSVIKAVEAGDVAYLLAHLIWPAEVDQKFEGNRERLVALASKATPAKNRKLVAAMIRHTTEGTWTISPRTARSHVEGLPDITLSRLGNRWFMHNVPASE